MKALINTAHVILAHSFVKHFTLAVEASDVGAGAALLQDGEDGVEHPPSYVSRNFDIHQKWCSTIERKLSTHPCFKYV